TMILRLRHDSWVWPWRILQPKHNSWRQPLQAPLARGFGQRRQGGWPSTQIPTHRERDQRGQFIADQAPDAPPTPTSLLVQMSPVRPAPSLTALLDQTGVKHFAVQPDLPQETPCTCPQSIQVEQALVAFEEQFDLPAAAVEFEHDFGAQDFR